MMPYIFFSVLVISFLLTGLLRWYAKARSIIDIPNERSSHKIPTPRGGGVAVVITFLVTLCIFYIYELIELNVFVALMGAGSLIAIIGFVDDHQHVPSRYRLLIHFISAIWLLAWIGVPRFILGDYIVDSIWILAPLAAFYIVWLVNLYNFMDGIDGLASIECITVCIYSAIILAVPEFGISQWFLPVSFAMAVSGFLIWNFPPAKIFMGDAGSGFMGLILGAFSVYFALDYPSLFWCWVILLGVFTVDSTFTLIRRVINGEKFNEAHRSHAYQIASRKYNSHLLISFFVFVINTVWLLPIALLVAFSIIDGTTGFIIAYIPLILMAVHFQAGLEDG